MPRDTKFWNLSYIGILNMSYKFESNGVNFGVKRIIPLIYSQIDSIKFLSFETAWIPLNDNLS